MKEETGGTRRVRLLVNFLGPFLGLLLVILIFSLLPDVQDRDVAAQVGVDDLNPHDPDAPASMASARSSAAQGSRPRATLAMQ